MKKILVIDDLPEICEVITKILEEEGYNIESCIQPRKALRILDQHTFDLVITDIMMPELSGLDLIDIILNKFSAIKILVMTGDKESLGIVTEITLDQALKFGAHDVIMKPFVNDDLITKVKTLIG